MTPSVFNRERQQSPLAEYFALQKQRQAQAPQYNYGLEAKTRAPSAFTDAYFQEGGYDTGYGTNTGNQNPESAFNLEDGLKYGQAGVNIGGGIMGLVGAYQQNKRAKEAMGMAREDQTMRRQAQDEYMKFRGNTRSAFN